MKKILFLLLFWTPFSSIAQNEYLKIPEFFFDKEKVNDIIDSLKIRGELGSVSVWIC